jgi:hypothetical protein
MAVPYVKFENSFAEIWYFLDFVMFGTKDLGHNGAKFKNFASSP